MTDSFFHELDRRGHESLLEKATGSVRFDLADGRRIDRWSVQRARQTVLEVDPCGRARMLRRW